MQLNNFIFKPSGMDEEYEIIKRNQELVVRLNGNDKKALELAYRRLEEKTNNLTEYIKRQMIEIALTEKALAEISDSVK